MRLSGAGGIRRQDVKRGAAVQRLPDGHAGVEAVQGGFGRHIMQQGAWQRGGGDTDGPIAEAGLDQAREREFERRHRKAHNLAIHHVPGRHDPMACSNE